MREAFALVAAGATRPGVEPSGVRRVGVLVLTVLLIAAGLLAPAPAAAATRGWTGGGSTSRWSEPANWAEGVPAAGDDVVIASDTGSPLENDLAAGTILRSITFSGSPHVIVGGNAIGVSAGLSVRDRARVVVDLPVELASDQAFTARDDSEIVFLRQVDLNGHALTVSGLPIAFNEVAGGGRLVVADAGYARIGDTDLHSSIVGESGVLEVRGTHPGEIRTARGGELLIVDGETGPVSIGPAGSILQYPYATTGATINGPLVVAPSAVFSVGVRGVVPASEYSHLAVNGSVDIRDARLNVFLPDSYQPPAGSRFTIVDNDGSDAITGSFRNVPEGLRFSAAGSVFRITYRGGDGNDIVLESLGAGVPTLRLTSGAAGEGDAVRFAVELDPPGLSSTCFTIETVDGSAVAGDDYANLHETRCFDTGAAVMAFALYAVDDDDVEPAEHFSVRLTPIFDAAIAIGEATLTIIDNDAPPPPPGPGYRLLSANGAVFDFGSAAPRLGASRLGDGAAAIARPPGDPGYWVAFRDGRVYSATQPERLFRDGAPLNKAVVGMASTASGHGYWLVAADGGIFSEGDAAFHGSTGDMRLNQPIVGMASTASGHGYWLVAADGGIFTFGDAAFHGSTGDMRLNQPIVGMAATPGGHGYWLVARDGGIFTFGDARFHGSTGAIRLNQPIVGAAPTPSGDGYWLVAADGGIFTFGDATFLGSTGGASLTAPIVGIAA